MLKIAQWSSLPSQQHSTSMACILHLANQHHTAMACNPHLANDGFVWFEVLEKITWGKCINEG